MSSYPRKGIALVLCAPSGTGKTTLARRITARYQRITFSVSCTTRAPRTGEVEGKDYYFVQPDNFKDLIAKNHFAEWAEVHGNYYGTPLSTTREILNAGNDLLFDVDVQGAAQLKKSMPDAYFVFILPPSRQALENRLRTRGSEDESSLQTRLSNAAKELKEAHWFDAWVINDDQEKAFQDLCAIYQAAGMNPARRPHFLEQLIGQF
ncbi:guanylate kinase [Desulfovibrio sp. OttesenSCG-928-F07]|nr:guanylate kinase [Desulfovibrio sp. OttesenSCG-928-F07]